MIDLEDVARLVAHAQHIQRGCYCEYGYRCGNCQRILDVVELANKLGNQIMAPVCPEHPRYQAKRKPRVPCEACWRRFIHLNPG